MKKTEYDIEVVFYTSVYIPVKAFGPDEAMDKAGISRRNMTIYDLAHAGIKRIL